MAFDEVLAGRTRQILIDLKINFEETKMMGGLTFMVNQKMCVGIVKNKLMARIDPNFHEEALTRTGCTEMDFTGKPMKGFVFIEPAGTSSGQDLTYWINKALEYNPKLQHLKKRKKK